MSDPKPVLFHCCDIIVRVSGGLWEGSSQPCGSQVLRAFKDPFSFPSSVSLSLPPSLPSVIRVCLLSICCVSGTWSLQMHRQQQYVGIRAGAAHVAFGARGRDVRMCWKEVTSHET